MQLCPLSRVTTGTATNPLSLDCLHFSHQCMQELRPVMEKKHGPATLVTANSCVRIAALQNPLRSHYTFFICYQLLKQREIKPIKGISAS